MPIKKLVRKSIPIQLLYIGRGCAYVEHCCSFWFILLHRVALLFRPQQVQRRRGRGYRRQNARACTVIRLTCHWVAKIGGTYMGTYFCIEILSTWMTHNFFNIDSFLIIFVPFESSHSQLSNGRTIIKNGPILKKLWANRIDEIYFQQFNRRKEVPLISKDFPGKKGPLIASFTLVLTHRRILRMGDHDDDNPSHFP